MKSGVGLGFRWELQDELFEKLPTEIDFLEICPENFMRRGGAIPAALERARNAYPILTHGLTMSLGGCDPLRADYLSELRAFIAQVRSPWHSDHLCFGSESGRVLHDLLPIALTETTARRVADRVKRAQDALGVPLAVENITFYAHPSPPEMGEADFIARVCELSDCKLMLDVNNAWVNAQNHGFDVFDWMKRAPLERTVQIHVAGHERFDAFVPDVPTIILDTHGAPVCDPVLDVLERVLPRTGDVPILLERDTNIPSLDELLSELRALSKIRSRVFRSEKNTALAEVGE